MTNGRLHSFLYKPSNTVVLRSVLVSCLGYENNEQGNRSLDALVHRLRLKKDGLEYDIPVKTVHGSGYIFSAPITIV
ncbi:MAG: helix-turn-helix domain-containing protein [Chlorobium sp.]|nr:MAG: helix-turn-helix domain-containing protein [Chlorobium sp.]